MRYVALAFGLAGLAVLASDFVRWVGGEGFRLSAFGEWWAWAHRDSLLLLQPAVERHISPAIWDPGIQTVLEWPLAVELFGVSALFGLVSWMIGRRRRADQR